MMIVRRFQRNAAWEELGERLGFECELPSLFAGARKLEGSYKGRRVRIDTWHQGTGNSPKSYTCYRVNLDDRWSDGVEILPFEKGLFSGEPEGYRTGNPAFDEHFEILGPVDGQVEQVLNDDEVCGELQRLSERYEGIWIGEGAVRLEHLKVSHEPTRMKKNLDRMSKLADAIEAALNKSRNREVADPVKKEPQASGVAW